MIIQCIIVLIPLLILYLTLSLDQDRVNTPFWSLNDCGRNTTIVTVLWLLPEQAYYLSFHYIYMGMIINTIAQLVHTHIVHASL